MRRLEGLTSTWQWRAMVWGPYASCDHEVGKEAGVGGAHEVGDEADVGGGGHQICIAEVTYVRSVLLSGDRFRHDEAFVSMFHSSCFLLLLSLVHVDDPIQPTVVVPFFVCLGLYPLFNISFV